MIAFCLHKGAFILDIYITCPDPHCVLQAVLLHLVFYKHGCLHWSGGSHSKQMWERVSYAGKNEVSNTFLSAFLYECIVRIVCKTVVCCLRWLMRSEQYLILVQRVHLGSPLPLGDVQSESIQVFTALTYLDGHHTTRYHMNVKLCKLIWVHWHFKYSALGSKRKDWSNCAICILGLLAFFLMMIIFKSLPLLEYALIWCQSDSRFLSCPLR